MAADAVGADHHDRADGVLHRLRNVGRCSRRIDSLDLPLELRLQSGPVAVEGGNIVAGFGLRPAFAFPAGTPGVRGSTGRVIAEFGKEGAPAFRHRRGILRVGRLHLFEPERRAPVEERGLQHRGVAGAARAVHRAAIVCHFKFILPELPPPASIWGRMMPPAGSGVQSPARRRIAFRQSRLQAKRRGLF